MTEKFIWSNVHDGSGPLHHGHLTPWRITHPLHNIYLIEGVTAESGYYRSFAHISGASRDQGDRGAVAGPRDLAAPVYRHRRDEGNSKRHSSLLSRNRKSLLFNVSGLEFFGSGLAWPVMCQCPHHLVFVTVVDCLHPH